MDTTQTCDCDNSGQNNDKEESSLSFTSQLKLTDLGQLLAVGCLLDV